MLATVSAAAAPAAAEAPHPSPVPSRATVPLGAAVWWACLDEDSPGPPPLACPRPADPRYAAAVEGRFDSITPENEFKMLWTQPAPDRFDFSVSDRIVDWAGRQRKPVRGHTLVYAGSNAWWVDHPTTPWTRESLLGVMRTRIATMVGRYRGRVASWDVVNEPFVDAGGRDPNLYERVIGSDWIEQAFRMAHAADPMRCSS